jgi:hypothetical protein
MQRAQGGNACGADEIGKCLFSLRIHLRIIKYPIGLKVICGTLEEIHASQRRGSYVFIF